MLIFPLINFKTYFPNICYINSKQELSRIVLWLLLRIFSTKRKHRQMEFKTIYNGPNQWPFPQPRGVLPALSTDKQTIWGSGQNLYWEVEVKWTWSPLSNCYLSCRPHCLVEIDLSWCWYQLSAVAILEYDFLLLQHHFILKSMPQLS